MERNRRFYVWATHTGKRCRRQTNPAAQTQIAENKPDKLFVFSRHDLVSFDRLFPVAEGALYNKIRFDSENGMNR